VEAQQVTTVVEPHCLLISTPALIRGIIAVRVELLQVGSN